MTFRNSTRLPEGRFSDHKRLPASLWGIFMANRDHSDPRTPRDIRETRRKPQSQVPKSPPANGFGTFGTVHERLDPSLRSPRSPVLHRAVVGASVPSRSSQAAAAVTLRVPTARNIKPSLATPKATSPTLPLMHRG
ncbi:hypothetical protein CRG98_014132 [Punica granatum]|uniref:Uncharacterized protein n=1 Tax=Punica granatum TaxID=22663 RepID=A0A2I0KAB8_PUNGR|nr:hypothetical protein CRG98_014132 [Punica granatum]